MKSTSFFYFILGFTLGISIISILLVVSFATKSGGYIIDRDERGKVVGVYSIDRLAKK